MKKILFIVNPKAGTGNKKKISNRLDRFIHHTDFVSEILYTTHGGHATALAAYAVAAKTDFVIAVGGDGTVNEIAKSLKNSLSILGIIPIGSGNGLARHFGISMNPDEALKTLTNGTICNMDTLTVNEHFSVNVSGVGFDAHIAQLFANNGSRGFFTYANLSLREFRKYRPVGYTLRFNDEELKTDAFLIVFANGSQWGNNAKIAPLALVNDGLLTIGVLKELTWQKIPFFIIKLFSGNLNTWKYIRYYHTKALTLQCREAMSFHIDGEPMAGEKVLCINVYPASLKIIVPNKT